MTFIREEEWKNKEALTKHFPGELRWVVSKLMDDVARLKNHYQSIIRAAEITSTVDNADQCPWCKQHTHSLNNRVIVHSVDCVAFHWNGEVRD